ncbi:AMP-binding protein [Pusillimonas noertemannii]|uniref:Long-chain-fatty-acid--CoA ligase n=1 Tax=Pusillimonas noertemannii TaxID=305977 RepID=A0A2U1CKK5_9BURK|nr:AMP-binding protein [Pusillimonas noertemannii]NYT69082.1 AMP-binding protein [Pusillimonas noertemannii]PVY61549.1 long-chain acyl-CoA synthetase [Pusillimonas noertemannii]TFL09498.1 long-chain fatty acid--CoA ligase [Pusillimonas noertemannii]
MQQPWIAHYPEGVPARISTEGYQSLPDLIGQACKKHGQRRAAVFMGSDLSYDQLDRHADAVAAWVQAQGLPAGSHVALMMPNVMAYLPIMVGVLRAGMVLVNINPMYTASELRHQLEDARVDMIFIFESFAATLGKVDQALRPGKVVLVSVGDLLGLKGMVLNFAARHIKRMVPAHPLQGAISFGQVLRQGAGAPFSAPEQSLDDVAVLQYTGGTTGRPKGAMLTHGNLVANVLQMQAVARPVLGPECGAGMVMLTALPLYHIFAFTVCGLFAMHAGMCSVLIADPRKLDTILAAWRRDPVSIFPAVNTLFNGLLNKPEFAQLDFSALRLCFGGGAAVQKAVAERWHKVTGLPLIEGYGLSETSPVAIVNPTNATEYSGDIGLPLPSTDVVMLDGNEREMPLGEAGEVSIRGPQVMKGYWNMPEETRASFSAEGYFKTGDIGIMSPEGRVRIIDRKKDMILVSGFNVYPNEVEQVIMQHPGVLECVVVGVPSAESGEMVKLFVVKKDPALTEAELREWCARHLTGYKRPHEIEFRKELPKSNTGKLLRRVLRDEAEKGAGA